MNFFSKANQFVIPFSKPSPIEKLTIYKAVDRKSTLTWSFPQCSPAMTLYSPAMPLPGCAGSTLRMERSPGTKPVSAITYYSVCSGCQPVASGSECTSDGLTGGVVVTKVELAVKEECREMIHAGVGTIPQEAFSHQTTTEPRSYETNIGVETAWRETLSRCTHTEPRPSVSHVSSEMMHQEVITTSTSPNPGQVPIHKSTETIYRETLSRSKSKLSPTTTDVAAMTEFLSHEKCTNTKPMHSAREVATLTDPIFPGTTSRPTSTDAQLVAIHVAIETEISFKDLVQSAEPQASPVATSKYKFNEMAEARGFKTSIHDEFRIRLVLLFDCIKAAPIKLNA